MVYGMISTEEWDSERLGKLWTPGEKKVWEVMRIPLDGSYSVRLSGSEVFVLLGSYDRKLGRVIEEMLNKIAPLGPMIREEME